MESKYQVTILDNMNEFIVRFEGPSESKLAFSTFAVFFHCYLQTIFYGSFFPQHHMKGEFGMSELTCQKPIRLKVHQLVNAKSYSIVCLM